MTEVALFVVGGTSAAAFVVGTAGLKLPAGRLREAAGRMLEAVGLTAVFLLVNVAAGVTVLLAGRFLTDRFVSLYVAGEWTWIPLSLVQALVFQWWRVLGRLDGSATPGGARRERRLSP